MLLYILVFIRSSVALPGCRWGVVLYWCCTFTACSDHDSSKQNAVVRPCAASEYTMNGGAFVTGVEEWK